MGTTRIGWGVAKVFFTFARIHSAKILAMGSPLFEGSITWASNSFTRWSVAIV